MGGTIKLLRVKVGDYPQREDRCVKAYLDLVKAAGIDYYDGALLKNPNWIKESHDLGMKVNVWTIDDISTTHSSTTASNTFRKLPIR